MRPHAAELAAAGARLVFVGTGTPAMAADFQRSHAGPHPVLSDVGRNAFRAAGLRRGLWSTLHWRTLLGALRAFRRGFRQARVQGDPWQQGGALVFSPDGRLLHQATDRAGGDVLDAAALLAAVRAA